MKLPEKIQYSLDENVLDYTFILKDKINAIIDYLSELHEQQKPCGHKNQISFHNSKADHGMKCKDCGFIISQSLG